MFEYCIVHTLQMPGMLCLKLSKKPRFFFYFYFGGGRGINVYILIGLTYL